MMTIHATYRNGVFTPTKPVELPEGVEVEFEVQLSKNDDPMSPTMTKAYEILSRRYDGLPPDLGERHNEHQP